MSTSLWAFDFDGVVCNSVGESSKSAWKVRRRPHSALYDSCWGLAGADMGFPQASAKKWPELFSQPDVQAREAEIEQKMRTVRPVVETGCVCSSYAALLDNYC